MTDKPPPDPADHAQDIALRYARELEYLVSQRMLDLGVDPRQIGASDHQHGIRHAAFHPHYRTGGGVTPDGRINLDSGLLNPELLAYLGGEAAKAWGESRWRDRLDAAIAHEYEEAKGGSHEYAYEHAPDTELPIGEHSRRLLRAIRDGERSR